MSNANFISKIRDLEFYSYGTTKIFERRMRVLSKARTILTFFGIVVPVTVGSAALSFGMQSKLLPYLFVLAGITSTIQLIISVWSLVSGWDEKYEKYSSSTKENTAIYNEAKRLSAKLPTLQQNEVTDLVFALEDRYHRQEQQDITFNVTGKEKRYAARNSYFYFRMPCPTCGLIPSNLAPKDCDTCGNYNLRLSKQ